MQIALRHSIAAAVLVAVLRATSNAGELLPAIPDFNVGIDSNSQYNPVLARLSGGRFVVAWVRSNPSKAVARIFDATGAPLTSEIEIAVGAGALKVAAGPSGSAFVVSWNGAYWQMFDADGSAMGSPVAISGGGGIDHIAVGNDGRVAAVTSEYSGGSDEAASTTTLRLLHYALDGTLTAGPVTVDEDGPLTTVGLVARGVAIASDGNTVVNWFRLDDDASTETGLLRRYSASGLQVGADIVFTDSVGNSPSANLATDGSGHIYVSYSGSIYQNPQGVPHLKRFNLDGSMVTELPMPADAAATGPMGVSAAGRVALVVFVKLSQYSGYWAIQRYATDGSLDGSATDVSDHVLHSEGATALSIDEAGSVVASLYRSGYWPDYYFQARVRRFCDTGDSACDICPAYDDTVDSDADLIPDGCDPCSTLDVGQIASRARTSISFWGTGGKAAKNQAKVTQQFTLAPGLTFQNLTPQVDGVRIRIEDLRGSAEFDESLPGGTYAGPGTRGWSVSSTRLTYVDDTTDPIHGIRKFSILDRSSRAPGAVRVFMMAFGDYYAWGLQPMRTIVVLGGPDAAIVGACSETNFTIEDCKRGGICKN